MAHFPNERVYSLICHGCGLVHQKTAWAISSPVTLRARDGREHGCYACPACSAIPGRIAEAYRAITNRNRLVWIEFQRVNWPDATRSVAP